MCYLFCYCVSLINKTLHQKNKRIDKKSLKNRQTIEEKPSRQNSSRLVEPTKVARIIWADKSCRTIEEKPSRQKLLGLAEPAKVARIIRADKSRQTIEEKSSRQKSMGLTEPKKVARIIRADKIRRTNDDNPSRQKSPRHHTSNDNPSWQSHQDIKLKLNTIIKIDESRRNVKIAKEITKSPMWFQLMRISKTNSANKNRHKFVSNRLANKKKKPFKTQHLKHYKLKWEIRQTFRKKLMHNRKMTTTSKNAQAKFATIKT